MDHERPVSASLAVEQAARAAVVDLLHELSLLTERYERPDLDEPPPAERSQRLDLLQATAAAGRRYLAFDPGHCVPDEQARARDGRAAARDLAAEERDLRASHRDREARAAHPDADPGFAERYLAAVDRDSSAGDRADALDDRQADRADRAAREAAVERPAAAPRAPLWSTHDLATHDLATHDPGMDALRDELDEHASFRQAQGVLMVTLGLSAPQASAELMTAAHWERGPLRDLVQRVLRDGWSVPAHDRE